VEDASARAVAAAALKETQFNLVDRSYDLASIGKVHTFTTR
jgi:hypothetical protein